MNILTYHIKKTTCQFERSRELLIHTQRRIVFVTEKVEDK
jgi:hypothetical protein